MLPEGFRKVRVHTADVRGTRVAATHNNWGQSAVFTEILSARLLTEHCRLLEGARYARTYKSVMTRDSGPSPANCFVSSGASGGLGIGA
jgi:hypothetical protein